MNIRPALPSDLPLIAALHIESWKDAYAGVFPDAYLAGQLAADLEEHWRTAEIRQRDVVLVAEDEGIIGFVAVRCRPEAYIDNLHVRPSERSKRTGAALMRAAARRLLRQGNPNAYLWVVETNERAIRFYERLGGARTAREVKDLFGHAVPSVRVDWDDVAVMLT